MPDPSKKTNDENLESSAGLQSPNCLAISERGIRTAQEFAQFMSAVMGDVVAGRLSNGKAAASTRAGMALLKVIEMQYRYGSETEQPGKRTLRLID